MKKNFTQINLQNYVVGQLCDRLELDKKDMGEIELASLIEGIVLSFVYNIDDTHAKQISKDFKSFVKNHKALLNQYIQ